MVSNMLQGSQSVPGALILFDKYAFSEPIPLGSWLLPQVAGICAILVADPVWRPKPFRVLCFEESANVAELVSRTEKRAAWSNAAGGRELFISVHLTPVSPAADRAKMLGELVETYRPALRCEPTNQTAMDQRLRDLESKYELHEAQFKLIMTALARMLPSGPEPPKRPIGFVY
jgi:hypothetical protein